MAGINFKGKSAVVSHHLAVPYHHLRALPEKSLLPKSKSPPPQGNMIIHGDNLLALKALLPTHAARVNCVYIDPPYNTGKEGWKYNDRVNNPMMREWLGKAVDREDLTRHDKWLCMMWPRLSLLHELLADDGVIFVSIDDNEAHHLRMAMDEIFGEDNFIENFVWVKKNVVQNDARFASTNHDHVICYRKGDAIEKFFRLPRSAQMDARYKNPDNDPKGEWQSVALHAKSGDIANVYSIKFPNGVVWSPPDGTYPKFSQKALEGKYREGALWFGKNGKNVPRLKVYLSDMNGGTVSNSVLLNEVVGSTQSATEAVQEISGRGVFESPKPVALVKKLVTLAADKNAIIMDSFAGSGTTAQAVLELNKEDGGERKFILVECEDYADTITAERVRRVIRGVKNAKDDSLRAGLGGGFGYWELGEAMEAKNLLDKGKLPSFENLARYVFYTATGEQWDAKRMKEREFLAGESQHYRVYLFYKPEMEFLRSTALTMEIAEKLPKAGGKARLVYAPTCYVVPGELADRNIKFCQLPFEIYGMVK